MIPNTYFLVFRDKLPGRVWSKDMEIVHRNFDFCYCWSETELCVVE